MKILFINILAILISLDAFAQADDLLKDDNEKGAATELPASAGPVTPAEINEPVPAVEAPATEPSINVPSVAESVTLPATQPVPVLPDPTATAIAPAVVAVPAAVIPAPVTINNKPAENGAEAVPVVYIPFDGTHMETLNNDMKSILFTDFQNDLFKNNMIKYRQTNGVGSFMANDSAVQAVVNGQVVTPQIPPLVSYTLNSVLYPEDENWTIWLNSKKIRQENITEVDPEIEIVSVTDTSAIIIVSPKSPIEAFAPDYKTKLIENNQGATASQESGHYWDYVNKENNVKVDSVDNLIMLKLSLHQTFLLNTMETYEGAIPDDVIAAYNEKLQAAAKVLAAPQLDADGNPIAAPADDGKNLQDVLNPNSTKQIDANGNAVEGAVPVAIVPAVVPGAPAAVVAPVVPAVSEEQRRLQQQPSISTTPTHATSQPVTSNPNGRGANIRNKIIVP